VKLFRKDTKVAALKRSPLFASLSQKELEELAQMTEDMEVDAGTVLARQGESGREFFVVLEGEVDVSRDGKTLEKRGGSDFFGELALVADMPRTATLTAKTPLRFFVLTTQGFRSMLGRNPDVELKVLRAMVTRLAEMVGKEGSAAR
jgi:CRP/FNR family transcriptional regulator, cyclic AMP receptor protein